MATSTHSQEQQNTVNITEVAHIGNIDNKIYVYIVTTSHLTTLSFQ